MNKEKQIEDMAKDIENADKVATQQIVKETKAFVEEHHRYHSILDFPLAHNKTVHELTAELLYDLGYRKIPKGSVVINKDENPCLSCPVPEDIQRDVDCSTICGAIRLGIDWKNQCRVLVKENKQLTKALAETRKETAREIATRIKAKVDEISSCGLVEEYVTLFNKHIDDIVNGYVEEVENG